MTILTNIYDINPRSKNQLMTLIYLLEMQNIDTKDIELTDWESLTVRLSLDFILGHRSKFKRAYVSAIYKAEKSYTTLGLTDSNFEVCDFIRFSDIVEWLKIIK